MIARRLSLAFTAGLVGGLTNSVVVWLCGAWGLTKLAPAFTGPWLVPRLVWGGLWGLLFLVPLKGLTIPARGLLFSLAPTLAQLFYVFPVMLHKGMMGLKLGPLAPIWVLVFNGVWGLAAAGWLKLVGEK